MPSTAGFKFPTAVLLNVVLGVAAAGGVIGGGLNAAMGVFGITLSEMAMTRSDISPKPQAAIDFEKDYSTQIEYGLPALAIGLVAAGLLKLRIGPESDFERMANRIQESYKKQKLAHERAKWDYLREHQDEIVMQLKEQGRAIIPSLEIGGWIPPTEPFEMRLDENKELVFGPVPPKYCSIEEFHFG